MKLFASINRIASIAWKEWLHTLRDARSLIISLIAPMFLVILFGYALNMDVKNIEFTVLDNDRSAESRLFLEKFINTEYFKFKGLSDNYRDIDALFNADKITMAIVIPVEFGKDISKGNTSIQLLLDGSDPTSANVSLGYVTAITTAYNAEILCKKGFLSGSTIKSNTIGIENRIWYNETLETRKYIMPGLIALILAIISALIASLTISREYERGTLETLMSTPLRPHEIILGKIVPYLFIGLFDVVAAITVGYFLFDFPLMGSFTELITISILFLLGTICMGILISAVTKVQIISVQFSMVATYLPTFILSGFIFPISNMPVIIQGITYVIPAKYLISIIKGIAVKGLGSSMLKVQIISLVIFTTLMLIITIVRFSKMMPYSGKSK